MPRSLIYKPLSWLYSIAIRLRHKLYDNGILRVNKFDIPIICIGNVTVGGTGKTPLTELIASHFSKTRKVAVLSRGYGRRTKGYLEVESTSHYRDVGDEPLQIKMKYPDIVVIVCEDRVEGINKIQELHPDVKLIIMDDGFQHRAVSPLINIVTIDATRPPKDDYLLPYGNLRDITASFRRAHYFVVTKCHDSMIPVDYHTIYNTTHVFTYQQFYFTRFKSYPPEPLFPDEGKATITPKSKMIALSGVGNPKPFVDGIAQNYNLVKEVSFDDHHVYKVKDLKYLQSLIKDHPDAIVITTEKDAVKLMASKKLPQELRERLYYIPINITFINKPIVEFLNNLEQDVKHNQANSAFSQ